MNSSAWASFAACSDLRVGRVRPAVGDVVVHRAMQQRGILRDHADLLAERFLRHLGDVLPVDEDAAALQVVETEEQVDQRRLAGAGAADQPDLFARPDGDGEILDDLGGAAIMEAGVIEDDLAVADIERRRVGDVADGDRLRQHGDAVLDGADALEQLRHFPDDPLRHGAKPHDEAERDRDRADGHRRPGSRRRCRWRRRPAISARVQERQQLRHAGEHAALPEDGDEEILHRRARVGPTRASNGRTA